MVVVVVVVVGGGLDEQNDWAIEQVRQAEGFATVSVCDKCRPRKREDLTMDLIGLDSWLVDWRLVGRSAIQVENGEDVNGRRVGKRHGR